jgi:AmiR/NasT family two-component response regulator
LSHPSTDEVEMAQRTEPTGMDGVGRAAQLEVEIEHLRRAVASRDVIGQAKGILMERYKVTADEAFALLVHASQHQNVRVADLSALLAETGEWQGPVPG